jgi:DNA-binding response OmpR family regulator
MTYKKPTAMVIDDHPEIHSLMGGILQGFETKGYLTLSEGLTICEKEQPDLVILDLHLHGEAIGFDGLKQFSGRFPRITIVIFTATDNDEDALYALRNGAQAYIVKDENLDVKQVYREILQALSRNENFQKLYDAHELLKARCLLSEAKNVELEQRIATLEKKPRFLDKNSKIAIATAAIIGTITTLLAVFGDAAKAIFKWLFVK